MRYFFCPCGAMEARKTSNLKVAGSSPAMDFFDILSEWLRSWTANPVGIARAGSNPAVVVTAII